MSQEEGKEWKEWTRNVEGWRRKREGVKEWKRRVCKSGETERKEREESS